MNVIKTAILLIICSLSQNIIAQNTQIGYVKTRGRIVDGKLIPGKKLSGVVIRIQGNNVIMSGNDGKFFFICDSTDSFTISGISKTGYELLETSLLNQKIPFSKKPLVIVMEEPVVLVDNKLSIERMLRRTFLRKLQQKEEEIESLKEHQKLSDEEYRKQLQELYNQQEDNEKLISEMVDRYSVIDFDEVDEYNRQISSLILEGRLTEAFSLINSKGDIRTRAANYRQHKAANVQEEQTIQKRQKELEKSKAMTQKKLEDLAQDCYKKFDTYKLQQKYDSASYYLDFRAKLDTTDYKLATETGKIYLEELSNDNKALLYFTRAKEIAIHNYSSEHPDVASSFINIGNVFLFRGNFNEAIKQYNQSLDLYRTMMGDSSRYVGLSLMNIGIANNSMRKYDIALEFYKKSLEIFENIYKTDQNKDIADVYNNMGVSCENKKEYELALGYYKKALEIRNAIYDYKHQDVAMTYTNIAGVYDALGDFKSAIENYQESIEFFKGARGNNHPDVALAYNNLAATYYNMEDYVNAKTYFEQSLLILSKILPSDHPEIRAVKENLESLKSVVGTSE